MTMVNDFVELFHAGGNYNLLRKLWGCFRAMLGPENPLSLCSLRKPLLVGFLAVLSFCFVYWLISGADIRGFA